MNEHIARMTSDELLDDDTEESLPDCIDCGLPIDECECPVDFAPPSVADRYDMRVDQAYDRLRGK